MAIIYTYPRKERPTLEDLVLISDAGTKKTMQASAGDLPIVHSFSTGETGLEPGKVSTGDIVLSGTLNAKYGGTGVGKPGSAGNMVEKEWRGHDQGALLYWDDEYYSNYSALRRVVTDISLVGNVLVLADFNGELTPGWGAVPGLQEVSNLAAANEAEIDQLEITVGNMGGEIAQDIDQLETTTNNLETTVDNLETTVEDLAQSNKNLGITPLDIYQGGKTVKLENKVIIVQTVSDTTFNCNYIYFACLNSPAAGKVNFAIYRGDLDDSTPTFGASYSFDITDTDYSNSVVKCATIEQTVDSFRIMSGDSYLIAVSSDADVDLLGIDNGIQNEKIAVTNSGFYELGDK